MKKILFVDDVPSTYREWQRSLRSLGFDVCVAARPDVAVRDVVSIKPSLVIMDFRFENYLESGVPMHMQWDGADAAIHIYNSFNIPVMFITVSPRGVKFNTHASVIVERFGLVDKFNSDCNLVKVGNQISKAIEYHQQWDDSHGVLTLNDEMRVVVCNNAAKKVVGEIKPGEKIEKVFESETVKKFREIVKSGAFNKDLVQGFEIKLQKNDLIVADIIPIRVRHAVLGVRCEWNSNLH